MVFSKHLPMQHEVIPFTLSYHTSGGKCKLLCRHICSTAAEFAVSCPTAVSPARPPRSAMNSLRIAQLSDGLSNCELDVFCMLEKRLSNKEIGKLLFISPETVKKYTSSIYHKLEVHNRSQAVDFAKKHGLSSPREIPR